ncbi:exonuclease SbcCD subunit D C-terminal domain-containing protein [Marivirga sp. S37H4]|uniref:Nuclease SbcCD subunit D n=1 Tax=Marivirga aurantiaca TaxID=2802615 RepID=A0A934X1W0_9BACT|nr:exonuclease subunit SbcD [Marivirga aurantiaca]MBK6267404.1 exonuclease SbcCD subunit D C-terminal domain-containing protein [Marivirga aurantiaca]
MKILHTADWHIGKKLHKHDLSQDFDLFINWLCKAIKEYSVEVLLVSGDVFDLANPSSESRKQFYQALVQLRELKCKIILTGGNHDSPAMLNAPSEILKALDMHVIGGMPDDISDTLIPVENRVGKTELVIAALPFLRDVDLRTAIEGETYSERVEAVQKGIQNTFKMAAEVCKVQYPNLPALAMGHLYAAGISTSDSERDIQIGNLAAFDADQFGNYFQYIALGHIHKPQQVKAQVPTFYSGSPIPLSFSEYADQKRVLIIDTDNNFNSESIPIPTFRQLLKVSGNIEQLQLKLDSLESHAVLDTLIEVILKEDNYDATKIMQFDQLVSNFDKTGFEIVKHRTDFAHQLKGASELYKESIQLEDIKPKDVFEEMIAQHQYDEETRKEILMAFDELLEEVQSAESAKPE